MARSGPLVCGQGGRAGETPRVDTRPFATRIGPRLEVFQFDAEYRALKTLHPVVEPSIFVLVASLFSPRAQQANLSGHLQITRDNRTPLTVGSEILSRVEAEAAELSHRSTAPALVL